MDPMNKRETSLADVTIHVRLKLSALWAAALCCYLYGDYFWLYQPGKLQDILDGQMAPFGPVTQPILLGTTISMAIPSAMIFLSIALKATVSRWLNVCLGAVYSVFVLLTMPGAWAFYLFLGTVDIVITGLIVWYAWNWPREPAPSEK
jgi:hypothetical protein